MAPSSLSLLLRHLFTASKHQNRPFLCPLARQISVSPFCSSLQSDSSPHPKSPSSLSARLSFVFDQIDQIEKERAEKDDALQRIKAWRESKKINQAPEESGTTGGELEGQEVGISAANGSGGILREVITDEQSINREGRSSTTAKKEIELAHPWPEWIEFVERLVRHNYFDHRRKDEDMVITNSGLDDLSDVAAVEEVFDFTKDWKSVQTAVLNFGRDRFDIFRSLSRHDIQILVGYGCPSKDRKLIFSAKLLRKYVHLDEGDVCSTCSLRSTCEKAYLLTNNDDEARSIDVVRVLLTYAFEPINGSVENKSLLKRKSIKTVIRKLLHEVVKLSSVPIDPTLPPPVIKKRPPKVKQPPPPPKRRVGRDDVEMKKGDWLCPKCDFMNFAKNVICLQCDAKRPKRQLLPGEWECPKCNFLNYRRNMACFHCEHKRPADDFSENQMRMQHQEPRTSNLERAVNRAEVYNAWNFDFDDDESDGADVAAFEYADTLKGGGTQSDPHAGSERVYPSSDQRSHDAGFNDFDDEEDDDINSYELEDPKKVQREEMSTVEISDVGGDLLSDDDSNDELSGPRSRRMGSRSSRRHTNGLRADDIDFGSDDDLPVHPKWKSSHVADFRPRGGGRSRGFNSDEDDIYSGHEFNSGFRSSAVGGRRRRSGGESSHGRDLSRKRSDLGPRRNGRREEGPWSDVRPRRNNERGEVPSGGGRSQNWSLTKESHNRSNMGGRLAEEEKPRRVRVNVR